LRQTFKPEFLNRVDDIILFRPLTAAHISQIVELQLARVRELLGERKITIELTDRAKQMLSTEGYDPAFGARPLKRAIQRLVQNPLAMALLEGRFTEGDHIVADMAGDESLTFTKAEAVATSA
jgi:ATP-dependent Clp protease ATP-binding subunit ClpB